MFVLACTHHTVATAQVLPVDFYVTSLQRYDSNLFRLPDGVSGANDGQRSSYTWSTGVGLKFDKTYGLQRFIVDGGFTHDHYTSFGNLDYTGRHVSLQYNWTLTSSLTGDLIYRQSKVPTDFAYSGYLTDPNPSKTEEKRFDIDWRPGAALHPRFSVYQAETRAERVVFQQENSRSTSYEGSLIYDFRSGNTVELYGRYAPGDYVDNFAGASALLDQQFKEREVGLRTTWQITGTSTLSGNVGYMKRTHETYGARNFDGGVGALRYVYTPTGKTAIEVSVSRSLSSSQSNFSSYFSDETVSLAPVWYATGKLTVKPSFSVTRRVFRGSPFPVADELKETFRSTALRVDYAALRNIDLAAAFIRSTRASNDPSFQYLDNGAFFSVNLKF